jgi:hypothetical protein
MHKADPVKNGIGLITEIIYCDITAFKELLS